MTRVSIIDPATASGKAKDLLDGVQKGFNVTPNLAKALANSPAALEAWISFDGALRKGSLDSKTREEIALVVAESNGCEYCLSAHTAVCKLVGLSDSEILNSRDGRGRSAKGTAALTFARELVEKRGQVPASSVDHLRAAGFTDGDITEIIANVALSVFPNYFNIALGVDIDFPRVSLRKTA